MSDRSSFQRRLVFLRALVVWFGLVFVAVTNGALRESVIVPRLGAGRGGQLSAILLAVGILLVTHLTIQWIAPAHRGDAWLIGSFGCCWFSCSNSDWAELSARP
jgi:hypothetical protein